MSFVKALAAVAFGFAAAKGMDNYKQMGGMFGLQHAMKSTGSGDMADQLGKLADQFGVLDGSQSVRDMVQQMGSSTAAMPRPVWPALAV